ncbi:MAG: hypothetical protein GX323_07120 [Clostridiales bacterium]|nr:hypothetical protein [Clostridiales bacterium]
MSGYSLKLIAVITMLIDHVTAVTIPPSHPFYFIGRAIGRLSFPIFCFLLVEGYKHTSNLKKYLLRLLAFAFLSEFPFDFAFYNPLENSSYLYHQNIFFTLLIGLLVLALTGYIKAYFRDKRDELESLGSGQTKLNTISLVENLLKILVLIIGCLMAFILRTDYSYVGILMIWAFYRYRNNRQMLYIWLLMINIMYGYLQVLAVASLFFISQYNGERGKYVNKYIFYGFYPIHLLVLIIFKLLLT